MIESVEELVIDRSNFQKNRKAYGITILDVAKKSGLSSGVISNYENFTGQYTQTRTRDDNARTIVRALKNLIQEKIDSTFINENKLQKEKEEKKGMFTEDSLSLGEVTILEDLAKESKKKNEIVNETVNETVNKEIKVPKNYKNGYDKGKIIKKLKDYCAENNIIFSDFCTMCGINHSTLAPYSIRVSPVLSEKTMNKICEATGWNSTKFEEDKYYKDYLDEITPGIVEKTNTKVRINTLKEEKKEEKKEISTAHITPIVSVPVTNSISTIDEVQIQDKKYTFQDGICFEEYTEIRHVKHIITKEQFINAIQNTEAVNTKQQAS